MTERRSCSTLSRRGWYLPVLAQPGRAPALPEAIYGPNMGILRGMPSPPNALRVRLPQGLADQLRELAEQHGVSLNSLLIALIAGGVGFNLKPDPDDPQEGPRNTP